MTHYGVALGRFQPIHLGHVEYLQAARDRCEHLVIGITNPNLSCLPECPEDPSRTKVASNPFTYFERARLIELTAAESLDEHASINRACRSRSTIISNAVHAAFERDNYIHDDLRRVGYQEDLYTSRRGI